MESKDFVGVKFSYKQGGVREGNGLFWAQGPGGAASQGEITDGAGEAGGGQAL